MRRLLIVLLLLAVAAPATARLLGDAWETRDNEHRVLVGPVAVVIETTTTTTTTTTTAVVLAEDTWEAWRADYAVCGQGLPPGVLNYDCMDERQINRRANRLRLLEEGPGMPGRHSWSDRTYSAAGCPRPIKWPLLRPYHTEDGMVFPVRNRTRYPFVIATHGAPLDAPFRVRVEAGASLSPPWRVWQGGYMPGGDFYVTVRYEMFHISPVGCTGGKYRLHQSDVAYENWWA